MELDLKDIGQTLAVGALGVFGLLALVRIFLKTTLIRVLVKRLREPLKGTFLDHRHHIFVGAVYLALIFAFGITLEDLSKNIVAERSPRVLEWLYHEYIPTDKVLRVETLFEFIDPPLPISTPSDDIYLSRKADSGSIVAKPIPLAFELADARLLGTDRSMDTDILQRWLVNPDCRRDALEGPVGLLVNGHDLENLINRVYYVAHNDVYLKESVVHEMEKIEARMDFARAMLFASLSLLGLLALLTAYYLGEYCYWHLRAAQWATMGTGDPILSSRVKWAAGLGFVSYLMIGIRWSQSPWSENVALKVTLWWLLVVLAFFFAAECPLGKHLEAGYLRAHRRHIRGINRMLLKRAVVAGFAIVAFAWIGSKSFVSESESYNIRIFGYYRTLHSPPRNQDD